MTGLKESDSDFLEIRFVRFCAGRQEYRVATTPYDQGGWLILTQILLPLRVGFDVGVIVVDERSTYAFVPRLFHSPEVEVPGVWAQTLRVAQPLLIEQIRKTTTELKGHFIDRCRVGRSRRAALSDLCREPHLI